MLSINEIIFNKLNLINHKNKFEKLKIINEYKDYLLLKNVSFLYSKNKSIYYYFAEMYYKGYGHDILKCFFSKNKEKWFFSKNKCFLNYNTFRKYIKKFKVGFITFFDQKSYIYHNIYPIIEHKNINLIETFINIIYKYTTNYEIFVCLKKLLQYIININDFIFFTKFYNIFKEIHYSTYKELNSTLVCNTFLNIFSNIIINNCDIFTYCNNLGLVSDKNKSSNLIKWCNKKNYIIFISGYLKNKPDKTNIFTNHDIAKYICNFL